MKTKHLLLLLFLALMVPWAANAQTSYLYTSYTATAGITDYVPEGYPYLVDNDINTKWCVGNFSGPNNLNLYIEFYSAVPIIPTGYVLTTANDTYTFQGRNPRDWTIKAKANPNDEWTTIATVIDDQVLQNVNYTDFEFSVNNPDYAAYQYFRFDVSSIQSGICFQLAEMKFLVVDETPVLDLYTSYTATAGVSDLLDQGYPMLVDNNINTKWCVGNFPSPDNLDLYIEFQSDEPITPLSYVLTTADDTYTFQGRNPRDWTIKAKANPNDEWTTLASVTNDQVLQNVNYTDFAFSLNNPQWVSYQYFRFEVSSIQSGGCFQLSELKFKVVHQSTCPRPADVNILYSHGSTALVSWISEALGYDLMLDDEIIPAIVNPFMISGFAMNASHTVKIRAYCNNSNVSWWSEPQVFFAVENQSNVLGLPYCDSFENEQEFSNWTLVDGEGYTGRYRNSATSRSGAYLYLFDDEDFNHDQYLISPCFEENGGMKVSFYYTEAHSSMYPDIHFQVGYSTTNSSLDAFQWGQVISYNHQNVVWEKYENQFPAGTKYIAIKSIGHSVGNTQYLQLDDFSFEAYEGCYIPTNLAVSYSGGATATVTWEGNDDAQSYNLNVNGTVIYDVTSPYVLENLDYLTTYNVRAQADCGEQQSIWTLPQSFRTDCSVVPLPFFCGFEDESEHECMSFYGNHTGITHETSHFGASSFCFHKSDDSLHCLLSNEFDETLPINMLFYYKVLNDSVPIDFQVGYSTTSSSFDDFIWYDAVTASNSEWARYEETFPTGTKYVAIKEITGNGNYLYLDDLNFTTSSHLILCTDLTVRNIRSDRVTLDWTENGTATSWEICLIRFDSILITASSHPFTLTGLTPSKNYVVKIRSVDEYGHGVWSDAMSFKTSCEAIAIDPSHPWQEDFNRFSPYAYDGILADRLPCWESLSNANTSYIYVDDPSINNPCLWMVASDVYPVAMLALPEFSTPIRYLNVAFNYKFYDFQESDTAELGYVADITDASSFVKLFDIPVPDDLDSSSSFSQDLYESDAAINAPEGSRLAIHLVTNNSPFFLVLDDLEVNELCFQPDELTVDNITHNSADISWTNYPPMESYTLRYREVDNPDYQYINNIETTDMLLTDLAPNTDYEVAVKSDCMEDSWCETQYFTTLEPCATPANLAVSNVRPTAADLSWMGGVDAESYTVNYRTASSENVIFSDGFENGIGAWTLSNTIAQTGVGSSGAHSGTSVFHFVATNDPAQLQYLISPQLTGVAQGMRLEFYYKFFTGPFQIISFRVGFSATDKAIESFTFGEEITPHDRLWNLYSEPIPEGTKYICWKFYASATGTLSIDDIAVGATIPAGEWQTTNVAGGSTQVSFTLSGLSPETSYEAYVYPSCDPNKVSETVSFTTPELTTVTQTLSLSEGENWVSFYVATTLNDLKDALLNALGDDATSIKITSQSNGYTDLDGSTWRGTLNPFDVSQMYVIEVPAACDITLEAMPINPAEHPITIVNGINWIGFPFSADMTLTNAFSGFAVNGDKVTSLNGGSANYQGSWNGGLSSLEPGQGYKLEVTTTEQRTLIFPTGAKKATPFMPMGK